MSLVRVDSRDLANYILAKVGVMNHLKLQKLVYYTEAYHLAYFGKSLVADEFEAWLHGPVSRKLWDHIKEIANVYDSIPCPKDKNATINNFKKQITKEQLDLIDDVLKTFGKKSSYALECHSHAEEPWKRARVGYAPGDNCEKIIDKAFMRKYYSQYIR